MRRDDCFLPDELDQVLSLPDEHPRRLHARSCPRCGALLDSYRLYSEAPAAGEGSDEADAATRLREALRREIALGDRRRDAAPSANGPSWLQRFIAPPMRPALALAAIAIVAGAVMMWPRAPVPEGTTALRGGGAGSASVVAIESARITPAGLQLRWRAWPGADGYEVRFYSAELSETARLPAGAGTSLRVPLSRVPAAADPAATVLCRIYALRGGDVLAVSPARALEGK